MNEFRRLGSLVHDHYDMPSHGNSATELAFCLYVDEISHDSRNEIFDQEFVNLIERHLSTQMTTLEYRQFVLRFLQAKLRFGETINYRSIASLYEAIWRYREYEFYARSRPNLIMASYPEIERHGL